MNFRKDLTARPKEPVDSFLDKYPTIKSSTHKIAFKDRAFYYSMHMIFPSKLQHSIIAGWIRDGDYEREQFFTAKLIDKHPTMHNITCVYALDGPFKDKIVFLVDWEIEK
jgi:hypothetical protein